MEQMHLIKQNVSDYMRGRLKENNLKISNINQQAKAFQAAEYTHAENRLQKPTPKPKPSNRLKKQEW